MKGATKTRTQRRMEKRQAVILLALVLVVSLASFTLGVIVGRRGAERDMAHKLQETEKVLVAKTPALVTPMIPAPGTEKTAETQPAEPAPEELKLSFYDNLSKEIVPLGSGINLAPVEEQKDVKIIVQPPINLPDQPIVKKEPENVVAAVIEKLVQSESVTVESN
jgi:outer membrane biosynthesis protein TonB